MPLFQQLLFNAYDYHFYGDYRLAVIEAGTAFEIFIENFVKDLYSKLGKNESSIDNILEAGLINLLECHIKILTNHDFLSNPRYLNWKEFFYEVRNDIVHRGKCVSQESSKVAVETCADAIEFLLSLNNLR